MSEEKKVVQEDSLNQIIGLINEITLHGVELKVNPVTTTVLGRAEKHFKSDIRQERKEEFLKAAEEINLDEVSKRTRYLDLSLKTITSQEIAESMQTIDGIRYICWLCIKENQPDMTLDEIGNLITLDDIPIILQAMELEVEKYSPLSEKGTTEKEDKN